MSFIHYYNTDVNSQSGTYPCNVLTGQMLTSVSVDKRAIFLLRQFIIGELMRRMFGHANNSLSIFTEKLITESQKINLSLTKNENSTERYIGMIAMSLFNYLKSDARNLKMIELEEQMIPLTVEAYDDIPGKLQEYVYLPIFAYLKNMDYTKTGTLPLVFGSQRLSRMPYCRPVSCGDSRFTDVTENLGFEPQSELFRYYGRFTYLLNDPINLLLNVMNNGRWDRPEFFGALKEEMKPKNDNTSNYRMTYQYHMTNEVTDVYRYIHHRLIRDEQIDHSLLVALIKCLDSIQANNQTHDFVAKSKEAILQVLNGISLSKEPQTEINPSKEPLSIPQNVIDTINTPLVIEVESWLVENVLLSTMDPDVDNEVLSTSTEAADEEEDDDLLEIGSDEEEDESEENEDEESETDVEDDEVDDEGEETEEVKKITHVAQSISKLLGFEFKLDEKPEIDDVVIKDLIAFQIDEILREGEPELSQDERTALRSFKLYWIYRVDLTTTFNVIERILAGKNLPIIRNIQNKKV